MADVLAFALILVERFENQVWSRELIYFEVKEN